MFNIAEEDNDYYMLVNHGTATGSLFIFHHLLNSKFKESKTINQPPIESDESKPNYYHPYERVRRVSLRFI